jgi:hypothetical protein
LEIFKYISFILNFPLMYSEFTIFYMVKISYKYMQINIYYNDFKKVLCIQFQINKIICIHAKVN